MRKITVALLVLVLAACGGGDEDADDGAEAASSSQVGLVPSSATETTAAAAAKRDDPKVRRQVAEIDEDYLDEYKAEVEALDSLGGQTRKTGEERIDEVIDRACAAKAQGFPPPPQEVLGALMMVAGQTLAQNGHDVAGLVADAKEGNQKIADLVDC